MIQANRSRNGTTPLKRLCSPPGRLFGTGPDKQAATKPSPGRAYNIPAARTLHRCITSVVRGHARILVPHARHKPSKSCCATHMRLHSPPAQWPDTRRVHLAAQGTAQLGPTTGGRPTGGHLRPGSWEAIEHGPQPCGTPCPQPPAYRTPRLRVGARSSSTWRSCARRVHAWRAPGRPRRNCLAQRRKKPESAACRLGPAA